MSKIFTRFFILSFFSITTFQAVAQVTNSESFDGATFPPTGWTMSGSNASYLTRVTAGTLPTQANHSGAGELQWYSYSIVGTEDIITPMFDLSGRGGNTPAISLWFYRDVSAYNTTGYDGEGVNVWVNTTSSMTGGTQLGFVPRRGGQSASGTYLQSGATYTTSVSGWYQYTFNVPASFNTCSNYIVFDFVGKAGDNSFMDDVQYTSYPSAPSIGFATSPTTLCSGFPVTFSNTSTNNCAVSYYTWNFGDGGSTTVYNTNSVAHTYTYSNSFYPSVAAYDASNNYLGGNNGYVYVQQGSSGTFGITPDSACPSTQLYFDPGQNPGPFTWKISNGYTTNNYSFQRSFATVGTYTASLFFQTPCGADSIKRTFRISNTIHPDANFTHSPDTACPNKVISFNPTGSSATSIGDTHSWNFGDGKTSTLQYPTHSYTATGTYTVTHTLTNICNNASTQISIVKIVNSIYPSSADFSYSPNTTICPGIQISFFSSAGDATQWSWNFGDGNTATGQYPKHTYASSGTFVVTQTATNECNNSLSKSYTVNISGTLAPDSTFGFNPNPSCPGDIINFNGVEYYGKNYSWNFGDGNTSSIQYPSHKYATAGNYTVTYTVKNYCNVQKSNTAIVNVNGNIHINVSNNFNVYPVPACPTQPLTFDFGNWGFAKYIFQYGDGKKDTTANANTTHSYSVAGTYTASATAVNNCGKDTTFTKVVTINGSSPFPVQAMNVYPNNVCPGQNVNHSAPWGFPLYQWNMGDGSQPFTSQNSYVSYSYSATGTYIASVDVKNYCGHDTILHDTIKVVVSPYFTCPTCTSAYVNAASPSCPNSSVSFNASSGFPWYKWKFGDGDSLISSSYNATHTYTAIGTYNYSVKITNFCGVDTTLYGSTVIDNTVQVPNWLWLSINPNTVCPNQAVQFQTDNSYSSYHWNFGDGNIANGTGNASHTYTSSGTYNISVVVGNTCGNTATLQGSVSVDPSATFPSGMSMWDSPDPSCPNSPVTISTMAGYSSYKWDFGDGSPTLTTSTEQVTHSYSNTGNYYASVLVTNSCNNTVTLYRNITINNSVTLSWLNIYVPNNPACPGDAVIMNPQTGAGNGNGNAGITFSWNYGDGSPLDTTIGTGTSHTYTATGVYNVVLTASNACGKSATTSMLITINNTSSPQLNAWNFGIMPNNSPPSAVCPGDVLVFYFEGIDPNNSWNFGDGNTGVATDVFVRNDGVTVTTIKHAYAAGIYNYTLTLHNHCNNSTSLSKSITVSTGLLASGGFIISPPSSSLGYTTCGLVNFVAYGGKSFAWDFGDGNTLTTLSPTVNHSYSNAGSYTVKVIITNGCGNSATYTQTIILNGGGGTVLTPSVNSPTCNGGNNGNASVIVNGGQAPYTYTWTNSIGQPVSTNVSANNLSAGSYVVSVVDNNGCNGSSTVVLNNPAAITFSVSTTHSSCGGSNGTATISSIVGGTLPYQYAWSSGQTTSVATGLSMGSYAVTISDVNGCSSASNVSVSENGATVSVSSITNVTCNGGSNGAANISATGGTPPYTYAWSNGATTQNINSAIAGNYSVVVTDNGGCHSTVNAVIAGPSAMVVNVTSTVSPTCGNFDGKATANVSGGTSPYTYAWDANAAHQTTQTATGLPAGTYSVTITDAHGCTNNSGNISLSNSNAPVIGSIVTDVTCNGAGNGSIVLNVTGGNGSYLYTWSSNVGVSQINHSNVTTLLPGSYIVTVQDAAHCFSFNSYQITEPTALTLSVTNTPATCGNTDGTATALSAGGNIPYSYLWTGGQTTQTAVGLALGSRTVTVTDSKGCTTSATTTLTATTISTPVCIVSVDTLTSSRNIIVWNKPVVTNIDSFRVYREISSAYTHIANVAYSALSEYVDITNGVNPNITSYKYKISAVDHCGGVSALSSYHQTIHLSVSAATPCGFNLSWNDYVGMPITQYRIMRDSAHTGWKAMDSVSYGNTAWTDISCYPANDSIFYMLEIDNGSGCTASLKNDPQPMSISLNSSRSNVYRVGQNPTNVINTNADMIALVYPNPNSGFFTIDLKNNISGVAVIKVFNMVGEEVQHTNCSGCSNKITMDMSKQAQGVYYLQISTEKQTITKKIIIE